MGRDICLTFNVWTKPDSVSGVIIFRSGQDQLLWFHMLRCEYTPWWLYQLSYVALLNANNSAGTKSLIQQSWLFRMLIPGWFWRIVS
jgi:hypothetical protein